MKRLLTALLFIMGFACVNAQLVNPVTFSVTTERIGPDEITLIFDATIDRGWHVYSTHLEGGPTAASFHLTEAQGVEIMDKLKAKGAEKKEYDPMFQMEVRFFERAARFEQKLKLTEPHYRAEGYLEYGACNDETCLPPSEADFRIEGADGPQPAQAQKDAEAATLAPKDAQAAGANEDTQELAATEADTNAIAQQRLDTANDLWQPAIEQLHAFGETQTTQRSLWAIFLLGLLGGLLALLTPCVWPIIPMTVSFFLHRSEERRRARREALLYGISIVVIYLGLGILVTLLFGASALNAMSTNAVFNLFFFALLILFGLSFLGGFELTLPSSWNNKVNRKAETTSGLLSIFLMAFTLALVSFSCTGPIIGLLLVEVSTMGNLLGPAIGMLGFALALALPFSLFALFPTWLKKAPKSGQWMNKVKVTLGFIELAFALKFLSVADLAYGWHILDRETFLALWIVLALLLGLYLLGIFRLPHDKKTEHTGVTSLLLALIALAFAVYMVPGLWGAPLKAISAFTPPLSTQDFNLYDQHVEAAYKDYEQGMAAAKAEGKPVLIDFTGLGCVNCRKMESSVWTDPHVRQRLEEDFVLISLFVDDKQPLERPDTVNENDKQRILRTVGDRWSYLQRHKFGANTQPFYVILDAKGNPLNHSYAYDESVKHFLHFLQEGNKHYRNHSSLNQQ